MIRTAMDYRDVWNGNRVSWLYELARCGEVGASAVRVGLLFATFLQAEDREEVRPKFAWIAEHTHMSLGTLATAVKELEDAGFIRVCRFHAESNHYSMAFDGYGPWKRGRTTPFVPKVMKNPPKGRRPKVGSKN